LTLGHTPVMVGLQVLLVACRGFCCGFSSARDEIELHESELDVWVELLSALLSGASHDAAIVFDDASVKDLGFGVSATNTLVDIAPSGVVVCRRRFGVDG